MVSLARENYEKNYEGHFDTVAPFLDRPFYRPLFVNHGYRQQH